MADVFLSYAREDTARAQQVANGLQAAGIDVFWDNEIPPGTTWADYIEQKLTQCKALIVLWSEHSTKSQWVREEARMGRDKGVLIPVMIDNSQPPFGFGEVQAANLSTWNGEAENPNWRRFIDAVANHARAEARPAPAPQPAAAPAQAWSQPQQSAPERKRGIPVWVWVSGAVVATVVVLGVIGAMLPQAPQQSASNQPQTVQPVIGQQQQQPAQQQPQPGVVDYRQQILDRLAQVEQAFSSQGYQRLAEPVTGQLAQGQNAGTPVSLQAGGDYRIIGVCDQDCGDLDLILYDQANNVVSQDQLTDATPIVSVAPQYSGAYTVQAVMHNCTIQPCFYALVLYGRALQ
ncbi:MAG: toll/interleukin-1 receptor domain-containing protein [Hyphomonadaceae bacterium]